MIYQARSRLDLAFIAALYSCSLRKVDRTINVSRKLLDDKWALATVLTNCEFIFTECFVSRYKLISKDF
ncbi:hypothetical protein PC116_g6951 [Phytophthora cactorum]|nr:hypothetical protein C6341_g3818 [Phytophthora cactorum]KAG4245287.1 hypothetical protein PC116_g6951 [Phytophthora cactorum]